ncbi:MAG: hypothetical protein ACNA7M_14545 [Roseovarius sp.]
MGIRVLIDRDSYELAELADRWDISAADIRFLVFNGKLKLCVRIVARAAVVSAQELTAEGEPFWVPIEEKVLTGLAELPLRDAFRLVRDGEGQVGQLFLSGDKMVTLRCDGGISVSLVDLLVRREHAEALERELAGTPAEQRQAFDYRLFVFDGTEFAFTMSQARALAFMVAQTRAGAPDQHYLDILKSVGSAAHRLSGLFSRKPYWSRLLRKTVGRRGWYHLDPAFVIWLIAIR